MNKRDRARWAACVTMADVADCTADWLTGGIEQTPGHCGPPSTETTPYVMLLCAVNRRGFVTMGMDDGELCTYVDNWTWGPSVDGVISSAKLSRLSSAARRHGCEVVTLPRRTRREIIGWYRGAVQDSAYEEMRLARCVNVVDPVRGRQGCDSPLWAMLKDFAR